MKMKDNHKKERYQKQCWKYFKDGKTLLSRKDFAQASEKLWGASALMVKAASEHYGLKHDGHAQLFKVVDILAKKTADKELNTLFRLSNSLHINFYENWLTPTQVKQGEKDVEKFILKLKTLVEDGMVK